MNKKNLTKKDISEKIFRNLGFSKSLSLRLIDDFFESIIKQLIKSNQVKLTSFGTFKVINKKERIGRNPKTKVEAKISARKIRSKSNNMMIEFRKNFNSKTAVMENLLKKRKEQAELKRRAENMR